MYTLESRQVPFDACFNFRDLGGYRTRDGATIRWKTLYRSDTLHRLTEADTELFTSLGLRTVIDLRSSMEVEDHGRLSLTGGTMGWHHNPMLDEAQLRRTAAGSTPRSGVSASPRDGYVWMVDGFGPSVAETFKVLSREGALPAVFHCTSGKDRTGIIAALILDLLGVPDEVIAADYVLTEETRPRSAAWIEANDPRLAAFLAEIPLEWWAVRPEAIHGLLEHVRSTHGSTAGLLTSIGVTPREQEALRRNLLDG